MNRREEALRRAEAHAVALIGALRDAGGPEDDWADGQRLATSIREAIREELTAVPVEFSRAG